MTTDQSLEQVLILVPELDRISMLGVEAEFVLLLQELGQDPSAERLAPAIELGNLATVDIFLWERSHLFGLSKLIYLARDEMVNLARMPAILMMLTNTIGCLAEGFAEWESVNPSKAYLRVSLTAGIALAFICKIGERSPFLHPGWAGVSDPQNWTYEEFSTNFTHGKRVDVFAAAPLIINSMIEATNRIVPYVAEVLNDRSFETPLPDRSDRPRT